MKEHIPNALSSVRLASPLYLPWVFKGDVATGLVVTFLVCITDLLDGYLARVLDCQSDEGAKLDIVADKVFVYTLGGIGFVSWEMTWWFVLPVGIILTYDMFVMLSMNEAAVRTSFIAKVKTATLFCAVALQALVLSPWELAHSFGAFSVPMLWVSMALTTWSALHYWKYVPDLEL